MNVMLRPPALSLQPGIEALLSGVCASIAMKPPIFAS